jgi:hypothetical protein
MAKPVSWAIAAKNGETIVSERTDLPGHGTIVFGAKRFLMLTSHSKADLIASTDGATWEPIKFADDVKFNWLVWSGSEFIVGDGKEAYRSADGIDWKPTEIKARGEVKWSDGTRFITSSWPGKMAFSADGQQWKDAPPLTANGINRVIFGSTDK